MSRKLGNTLPDDLFERLRPQQTEAKLTKVLPLCSLDEAGFPHFCLLSHRELAAKDRRTLRLATYAGSSTTRNLQRGGKATLMVLDEAMSYYVKVTVRQLKATMQTVPGLSMFNLEVEQVIEDKEPQNPITSGVTFRNRDPKGFVDFAAKTFRELLED